MNVNPDGKSGTVYLKIYIPSFGFETTNAGFIRNVKAKNVHYSLVTYPVGDLRKDEKDGTVKMHFTGSIGYERNDAVPFEGGAMKQRVNTSEVQKINFELARELIENGKISRDDNGEEFLVNGKVSRPMLRRMVANADCERKSEIGELISMIDKRKNGGKPVELKEAMEAVKNAAANGAVNLADLMKNCGGEGLLRNAEDDKKIALANSLTAKLGDKPVEALDAILAENKANAAATVENAVVSAFGRGSKRERKSRVHLRDEGTERQGRRRAQEWDRVLEERPDHGIDSRKHGRPKQSGQRDPDERQGPRRDRRQDLLRGGINYGQELFC